MRIKRASIEAVSFSKVVSIQEWDKTVLEECSILILLGDKGVCTFLL